MALRKEIALQRDVLFQLALRGDFGTPDNPNRNHMGRFNFWAVFFEKRTVKELAGTNAEPYARAAVKYRRHLAARGEL